MDFRKNWWSISILIMVFGLFCVVIPILVWKGNLDTETVVEIFSIIISWPVAISLIGLLFIFRFKSEIGSYLENIRSMKLPGGIEIQSQESAVATIPTRETPSSLALTPEQQENIKGFFADLENKLNLTEDEKNFLSKQLDQMSYFAIGWKFSFLDLFLVYNTKRVLLWFSQYSPQTTESYHTAWQSAIPANEQRATILNLLIQYGLLLETEGFIRITDHGYSFLQFVGLTSPTPTASDGQSVTDKVGS